MQNDFYLGTEKFNKAFLDTGQALDLSGILPQKSCMG